MTLQWLSATLLAVLFAIPVFRSRAQASVQETGPAVQAADADAAFEAMIKAYWDPHAEFFRKNTNEPRKADFWFEAQIWDVVMDEYDRTHSPAVKRLVNDVYDGFVRDYPDWTTNQYNDDIMWWAIACTRAYAITHDDRYLQKARASFDFVYDHFTDDTLGGGIYWSSGKTSKNSCVNCPAVIAAVRLSVLLKDPSYLDKAKAVYAWQKTTLTDGNGKVFDNVRLDRRRNTPRVGRGSLTYNQGTFIGAAALLYQQTHDQTYLDDAIKTAQWTREHLCVGDERILRNEGQGDSGAFKGIFVRYMKLLIDGCGRREFLPWMQGNAASAWRNRRPADNIMGSDWTTPPLHRVQSQTDASAVAVVVCFAPPEHGR